METLAMCLLSLKQYSLTLEFAMFSTDGRR